MRFSEAEGHAIVSTTTAETVGRVDGLLVDPVTRRVVALQVKKAASGDTLLWEHLTGVGTDAVTVTGADRSGAASGVAATLGGKAHALRGKRLLSAAGDELGKVGDVEFDPVSGAITGILAKRLSVAGDRLIGVGSYAVVVAAD